MARDDDEAETTHPRAAQAFFGHMEAEQALLDAYRSGRIAHAWLIGGTNGIGKATLAYRMAKFVLAYPDPTSPQVQRATSLETPPDHPAVRHVVADTHGGLLTLERSPDEKGQMRSVISINQVRETVPFFGATAANSGWRVCIVDSIEDLKWPEAPNALLKILEEPPPQTLFLLVSHAPARVLPTILSRCRKLMLRPLGLDDLRRATAAASSLPIDDPELMAAAELGGGSVGRTLMLLEGDASSLRQQIDGVLATLPRLDPVALHQLADNMGTADRAALRVFSDMIDQWLHGRLHDPRWQGDLPRLARISEVWEKVAHAARAAESYNLERKPLVFSVFDSLSEIA